MKKFFILCLSIVALALQAGAENPSDSTFKKNAFDGYFEYGNNINYGTYGGFAGFYTRNFTDRISASAGIDCNSKRKHFFSSVQLNGSYRLPINKHFNILFKTLLNYTDYQEYNTDEYCWGVRVTLNTTYFDFTMANHCLIYKSKGWTKTEGWTPAIGMYLHLRKPSSVWDFGIFARNYDNFYFDNYNVLWGCDLRWRIIKNMNIKAEMAVQPAGTLSQLATRYALNFKLGAVYVW